MSAQHTATTRAVGPAARAVAVLTALLMLVTGCKFQGVYNLPLPGGADTGENPYSLRIEFRDVLDLVPRSAVKVGDVEVGQVTRIELDGWHARVTVEVRRDVRLPDNAFASIRQTSLLGEKYVQLSEPSTQEPRGSLGDGDVIPLSRTQRGAEVEEVLSALALLLNGGGLPQLRTINRELNAAMSGREDKIKSVIKQLDTFVGGLDEQKENIEKAIKNMDKLARQLKKQQPTINRTLEKVPPALKILTEQRKDLVVLLRELSKLGKVGTRVINASKEDLVANLKSLQPILTRLAEAGTDLPNALALMFTYPFPPAAANGAIGDYTNLHLTADLNLAQILQVVGEGGPTSGPPEQVEDLIDQIEDATQGPEPGGLLPSGMIPSQQDTGGDGGGEKGSSPAPTPQPSGPSGDSGGSGGSGDSGEDDDLVGLLLGGLT